MSLSTPLDAAGSNSRLERCLCSWKFAYVSIFFSPSSLCSIPFEKATFILCKWLITLKRFRGVACLTGGLLRSMNCDYRGRCLCWGFKMNKCRGLGFFQKGLKLMLRGKFFLRGLCSFSGRSFFFWIFRNIGLKYVDQNVVLLLFRYCFDFRVRRYMIFRWR